MADSLRLTSADMLGRLGAPYQPSDQLIEAANVALALRMPLLLTGEAGCGKSDFAWAAAKALSRLEPRVPSEPIVHHVSSGTEASDLLYRYDALRRFSDAHSGDPEASARAREPGGYIDIEGRLGDALCSRHLSVVLIDEIDKAPRDLPNDLLAQLEKGEFVIRELAVDSPGQATFSCVDGSEVPVERVMPPRRRRQEESRDGRLVPLVVITSNVERRLPDAFLRRCVFHSIRFPDTARLQEIVRGHLLHRNIPSDDMLLEEALAVFEDLRAQNLTKKPTTSEAIAWVEALGRVVGPPEAAVRALREARASSNGWSRIPALGCLVKVREDLDALQAG